MKRSEAVLIINKIIANKETAEEILDKLLEAGMIPPEIIVELTQTDVDILNRNNGYCTFDVGDALTMHDWEPEDEEICDRIKQSIKAQEEYLRHADSVDCAIKMQEDWYGDWSDVE